MTEAPAPAARSLSEKVLAIEAGFAEAGIAHAFGGAIALAYYATPRGTIDIDVNVFVPVERAAAVVSTLEALGVSAPNEQESARLARDGQARLFWGRTPIDLFFAYDAFHEACLERRVRMPFAEGREIHVLSAEDLVVFKTIFDRDKGLAGPARAGLRHGGRPRSHGDRGMARPDPGRRRSSARAMPSRPGRSRSLSRPGRPNRRAPDAFA